MKVLRVVILAIILGLFAQIDFKIPALPVSFSGQTFFILLSFYFITRKELFSYLVCYLIFGILGLPVFAQMRSGLDAFIGPSFGYFMGFLLMPVFLRFHYRKLEILQSIFMLFCAHLVILSIGTLGLLRYMDIPEALDKGFYPFLSAALLKAALIYFCVSIYRYFKKLN